jgi:hypothetical protein
MEFYVNLWDFTEFYGIMQSLANLRSGFCWDLKKLRIAKKNCHANINNFQSPKRENNFIAQKNVFLNSPKNDDDFDCTLGAL